MIVHGLNVFLQLKCQLLFFELATNQKFDIGIMLVILLNMATMSIEHYDEPPRLTDVLHYITAGTACRPAGTA